MQRVEFPRGWTGFTSAAALMLLGPRLARQPLTERQARHAAWELEKYCPCFCEAPGNVLVLRAATYLDGQIGTPTFLGIQPVALLHGELVLRERGREVLNFAISGMVRVAALADETVEAAGDCMRLAHLLSLHTTQRAPSSEFGTPGDGGPQGEPDPTFAPPATIENTIDRAALTTAMMWPPDPWTTEHAIGFLVYAARNLDRSGERDIRDRLALFVPDAAAVEQVELEVRQQYHACTPADRWVFIRAVEDQLAMLESLAPGDKQIVLRLLRATVSESIAELTPYRQDLVTLATVVLGHAG